MSHQSKAFYPQAAKRLLLAVVNQAIFDVLENNEEAKAAEQWLLSRGFDTYVALLDCDPKVFRSA
jgi:hypothetical protein